MVPLSNLLRGDLLILLAALIWGVAFYFQKTAMNHVGPLLFIGLRGIVAAFALLPFAVAEQSRQRHLALSSLNNSQANQIPDDVFAFRPVAPIACAGGCVFFVAGSIQQMGIVTATVTNTGFLTALYIVFTPFLFWIFKRKAPSNVIWLSTCLAMAGVWALSGGSVEGLTEGDMLVAVSSLFWALLIIVSGEAAKFKQPLSYTCIQFLLVGVLGLLAAFFLEVVDINSIINAAGSVIYVGLLSTALTFGVMAYALQFVPAPRASILLSLETLFAAMAGHAWLGERLSVVGWFGAILIMSAVVVLQVRRG